MGDIVGKDMAIQDLATSIHQSIKHAKEDFCKRGRIETNENGDAHGTARDRREYRDTNPGTEEKEEGGQAAEKSKTKSLKDKTNKLHQEIQTRSQTRTLRAYLHVGRWEKHCR